MPLTPDTPIHITPTDNPAPITGTIGGLIHHHRRHNPTALAALERAMIQDGRIPADPADVRDLRIERHLDQLTLADLEHLEAGATITLPTT